MIKRLLLIMTSILLPCTGMAGQTATLVKSRRSASSSVVPGTWHTSLSKCKTYARDHGVPLIAVWSNGDKCGHCLNFESACNNSTFKNWMKKSGCVFFFTHSGESGGGQGGTAYKFCEGGKGLKQFPDGKGPADGVIHHFRSLQALVQFVQKLPDRGRPQDIRIPEILQGVAGPEQLQDLSQGKGRVHFLPGKILVGRG